MDREELKKVLDKEGVKPVYYSLNGLSGGPYNGAIILEKEGNKWLYYYFERGSKHSLQYFNTEDEACRYMLQELTSDPLTRIYNPPNKQ
jgi:hypothetical protein